jgi:pimeloyl-ACP methyl ester carboxylesterase
MGDSRLRRAAAVAAAAALVLWGAASAEATPAATSVLHACRPGGRVLCGAIRVPLYRQLPAAGSVVVRYRVYPHRDDSRPPLEPVVAMEGGPGYGSIGSASTYHFLLGPLTLRHDLIVMDQRGTGGSGAIGCRALQDGLGNYVRAVGACARRLGQAAGAYGSAAVGDDLAEVLRALDVPNVDVYGDSYGSYAAQVFTIHHPSMVRALVLDGTYDQSFDPFEREASAALRHAWRAACARSHACSPRTIVRQIGSTANRLGRHPLAGVSRDADGFTQRVRLTAPGFAQLVFDATYYYTVWRDLPAAMTSLEHGDRAPMLRLAAEDVTANAAGGSPSGYSQGDYAAVACHDYPTLWNPAAGLPARRAELATAIAGVSPSAFAPFSKSVWLASLDENQLVRGCLEWPQPPVSDPPFPPGVARPGLPVLVLDGEFDQATPAADARAAARAFPDATFVEVASTSHISALADYQRCASVIVRRFIERLAAGDTGCASRMPPVTVMPSFPVRVAAAPQAGPAGSDDRSTAAGRRAAWVAGETVGDAFERWYNAMYGTVGHGLRGGRYTIGGAYLSSRPLTIRFHGVRLARDLSVSGRARWGRRSLAVSATLGLAGPGGNGHVTITWSTIHPRAGARVRGTIDGRRVDLRMAAPFAPHG